MDKLKASMNLKELERLDAIYLKEAESLLEKYGPEGVYTLIPVLRKIADDDITHAE